MPRTKNEEIVIDSELELRTVEDIVSDLLYTMFQSMEEYVLYKIQNGTQGDDITKMKSFIEKEMRKYAKGVYNVEVEAI